VTTLFVGSTINTPEMFEQFLTNSVVL